MIDESLHVAVVDIGSLTNLGWVVEGPLVEDEGEDIDKCVKALASAMNTGTLALGFEAPIFVPFGREKCDLDNARKGEGDRAFAASAGACVLTKGLMVIPYILKELRSRVPAAKPTFKWRGQMSKHDLLLFEAFVTHMGRSATHVDWPSWQSSNFLKSGNKERQPRAR